MVRMPTKNTQAKAAAVTIQILTKYNFEFYIFIGCIDMSNPGILLRHHSGSSRVSFSKEGPDTTSFCHLSIPFFLHQYKSLCRAEVTLANLTLFLYMTHNRLSL